ncbi:Phosphotransferase enzyme family, putative [Verrucomicrobiia bacterium DG1235]|nr:Phosphotransferase enzyme family, putative [Verrucomicrobiae bacterium DG1235]
MNIDEIIKRVPVWENAKSIRYEPLSGGYSNFIYKIFVDDKIYALRINGKQNTFLGLEYEDEVSAMSLAATQGLTPMVLQCENESDFLITEFIEGEMLSVEDASNPRNLNKVIGVLKKIHEIPYSGKRTSTPFSLTRGYLKGAEELGIPCPPDLEKFLEDMSVFEVARQEDSSYLKHYCHNDAFTHNMIISSDDSIKMLDWELSGLGDIWFDLATLSFSCGFDETTDEVMLKSYFGYSDGDMRKTLHDMKSVCMVREIGWALLHTAINRSQNIPGADYMEFSNSVLDRLKQGLVSLV